MHSLILSDETRAEKYEAKSEEETLTKKKGRRRLSRRPLMKPLSLCEGCEAFGCVFIGVGVLVGSNASLTRGLGLG